MTAVESAARMGARAAETYLLTGVSGPTPFDTSPDAPPAIRALAVAYSVAFVDALPRPAQPSE